MFLVLMDCEMPIMDGYESSKRIREFETTLQLLDDKFNRACVVGLSGNQGEAFERKCR